MNPDLYYKQIADIKHAPLESFLIYNLNGGIGYILREDYDAFCRYYIKSNTFSKNYVMDLAFAKYHSLVFDIDFKGCFSVNDKSVYLTTHLKPTLKFNFDGKNFTYICATRPNGGLHIHLPEFIISHDDYIHFCSHLKHNLDVKYESFEVSLDIPTCFTLSTGSKPGYEPYKPFNLTYIDENNEYVLPLSDKIYFLREIKKINFKNKKGNINSIFRKLIFYQYEQLLMEVLHCMMPYVANSKVQVTTLTYDTIISNESVTNYQPVCTLYYDNNIYHIFKSSVLNFKLTNMFIVYNYLNTHCFKIRNIDTKNYAIHYWFKIIKNTTKTYTDIFQFINEKIKNDNIYWREHEHPIRHIMMFNDGYYFLPVFYALCVCLKESSPYEILNNLISESSVLNNLIDNLKSINEKLFYYIAQDFSMDTVFYCASIVQLPSNNQNLKFSAILDNIIEEMKETVLQSKQALQFETIIYNIIDRYTPVNTGLYKHSTKKKVHLLWNVKFEYWQSSTIEEIKCHVQSVHKRIQYFLEKHNKKNELFDKIQIHAIANTLCGNSNMDRKTFNMDKHKFHIKTKVGILDLLSGHVSATVPEFYVSEKYIDVNYTRKELNDFRHDQELARIYTVIMSKGFFRKFLKYLLIDKFTDFFDTIKAVAEEFQIYTNYQYIDSILKFYCHLCKYTSFEYDMVIFMLFVISSIFIATNYYRRFFIFQGNTKNGKSKFFEMCGNIFGNYCSSVRSFNFNVKKNKNGPEPELTILHSCRLITVEELCGKIDENFIKEVTGNSKISCRALYEANAGGIPTAKVFASTNNPPECTVTDAFRDRVLTIPFSCYFTDNPPSKTSEQVKNNIFKLDCSDEVVLDSSDGMFLLSYCHLYKNLDYNTGLLNLPPVPDIMLEFKEEYLEMTDVYAQFKQHVDLQIVLNHKVQYNNLVSAVRRFLRETKKNLNLESTILKRFDEEFASHKKEENYLFDFFTTSPVDDDEEVQAETDEDTIECANKRRKNIIIYYENISMKNPKKR